MTPNWPELWAREPGLSPFTAAERTSLAVLIGTMPEDHGRALWESVQSKAQRDAAVRWLAEHDQALVRCWPGAYGNQEHRWSVQDTGDDPTCMVGQFDTPDAALFAACKTVLDAKETPCSNP